MAFVTRAFLYGEVGGFFQNLRDLLYRLGLRETTSLRDIQQLIEAVRQDIWPIIFVDGTDEGGRDSMAVFESVYRRPGFELFPYLLIGPTEDRRFPIHAVSLGAKGFVRKPLQPVEANSTIKDIIPHPNDTTVEMALEISKLMIIQKKFESVRSGLLQLANHPSFEKGAEVALLRIETASGHYSRAEERLQRLLKKHPGELRFFCEAVDYMRETTQLYTAMKFLKAIDGQKTLYHRSWEMSCLALEINELDTAANALNELSKVNGYRDKVMEGLVRMMVFMGLTDQVALMLKAYPLVAREFGIYQAKTRKVAV